MCEEKGWGCGMDREGGEKVGRVGRWIDSLLFSVTRLLPSLPLPYVWRSRDGMGGERMGGEGGGR